MLEAANARPRFTISLKRSTQNLQLFTSSPSDYLLFCAAVGLIADVTQTSFEDRVDPNVWSARA
jgi:hypothetical protein